MERLIRSPDEGVMPPERCSIVGTSDPSRDFRRLGLLTQVRTSDCQDFRPMSGLSTQFRASDCRDFRPKSGLPADLGLFGSGLLDSNPNCSKLVRNLENKA
jgi:hypothetical protein